MTSPGLATMATNQTEAVLAKLRNAPAPLKLAEAAKGLPKPKGTKAPAFQEEIQGVLDEITRSGQAFCFPSAKNGQPRWWSRDEKHLLRESALKAARQPMTLSALKKEAAKHVKGVDPAFVEAVVRELIGDDHLFEHPPKTKKGGPLFATFPPPPPVPPLEVPANKKKLTTLVNGCRALIEKAGVPLETLFDALRTQLTEPPKAAPPPAPAPTPAPAPGLAPGPAPSPPEPLRVIESLEELILRAVANEPTVSLAELRREMPQEFRGAAFDEAVFRLADEGRVAIFQDIDPVSLTEEQRAECVRDGSNVFTTIAKRS